MEEIVEFIKVNIPWIAFGLALAAAIAIAIVFALTYLKKKKTETSSVDAAETAASEVTDKDDGVAVDEVDLVADDDEEEEVRIIYKPLDEEETEPKVDKTETGKAKFAKKTAERISDTARREQKSIAGKWIVKEKGDGEYVAFLYANNGELILSSEIYSSADGAKKGVETIRRNLVSSSPIIYKDKNGNYYFKLKSVKNRILCVGETYKTKALCENAFESVKRFAGSFIQGEVEKDVTVIKYEPSEVVITDSMSGSYNGKWVIEEDDGAFMAKLFASNGELLLNSENYVSYESAKVAVGTITNNGLAGNFIIDSDKKNRYFFKLRSSQKATLCVGETYSQLNACKSAIDSVRRFLKTATLEENQN